MILWLISTILDTLLHLPKEGGGLAQIMINCLGNNMKERRFVKRRDVILKRRGSVKLRVGWRRRRGFSERGRPRKSLGNKERKRKNSRERKKRERCGTIITKLFYLWGDIYYSTCSLYCITAADS